MKTENIRTLMTRLSPRRAVSYIKAHKKEMFWLWITYQSIKGITTLTLIWIPLWLVWKNSGS